MDFTETDEQQMLREAVDGIASKYGHGYFAERARSGGNTDELWNELAEAGFLGVNVPAEYGGGGMGIAELAIVLEELAANGCPLLLLVVSPAICATIIAHFGSEAAEAVLAASLRLGRVEDGLRHHRARRRVQQPQDRHHRHTRRRHLAAQRDRSTTSRARTSPRPCLVVTRTGVDEDTGRGRLSLFVVDLDSAGTRQDPHPRRDRGARRSSSPCSSTTSRSPPTDCSAPRATGCARCSSGSTPSAS